MIIVESLLGPNLKKLLTFCDNKFPIITVCYIGIEVISRLLDYHEKGYIHRDIKPSNLVWGNLSDNLNELKDNIILIDYNLSGIYKLDNETHIPYGKDEVFFGNSAYNSINSYQYIAHSRRDDIELLMYVLIYLYKGDLPWNNETITNLYNKLNRRKLKKMKIIQRL